MSLIGILQTGEGAADLKNDELGYSVLWQNWITRHAGGKTARCYAVCRGLLPKSPHECSGWIVTGSDDHIYDRHFWMPAAEEFLRQVFKARVPLLGVCYGHQMLAYALGGTVERARTGLEIGLKEYDWAGHPEKVVLPAYHYDQVTRLPPEARLLARNASCPHAALAYGDHALTLQAHPEFSTDYLRNLIEQDINNPEDGPALRAGLQSLDRLHNAATVISRELGAFICGNSTRLA